MPRSKLSWDKDEVKPIDKVAEILPLVTLAIIVGVIVKFWDEIKKLFTRQTMKQIPTKPSFDWHEVLKMWQFWVVVILVIVTISFAIFSRMIDTSNDVVNKPSFGGAGYTGEFKEPEPQPAQQNYSVATVAEQMTASFESISNWSSLIVLLVVVGFMVGILGKLTTIFK